MEGSEWAADLALAHELADAADALTTARFLAGGLQVTSKPDLTPVTDVDVAVERLLRGRLARARPGDSVLAEEDGESGTGGRRRWVIDPIDGTKNFVRGVPVWATLIALELDGRVVVGVASAPALGRRWAASAGAGAYTGDRRIRVSGVGTLADASLSYSSLEGWRDCGRLDAFLALASGLWRTRAYGDFWSYLLVAEGAVDIAAEPEVSRWDLAALDIIVREAGGRFSALDGSPGPGGGSAVATNGHLHDEVLQRLAAAPD